MLNIGTNEIMNCFVGTNQIKKIYVGTNLIIDFTVKKNTWLLTNGTPNKRYNYVWDDNSTWDDTKYWTENID